VGKTKKSPEVAKNEDKEIAKDKENPFFFLFKCIQMDKPQYLRHPSSY